MSDKQQFRSIYESHHAAVCAYFARRAARDDVEDLAAETFAIAWRKLPRRVSDPLPWLYAVAGNVLANHRRRLARRGEFALDPSTGDPAERFGGDRGLAVAFAQLGERDREALCLVAWEGLSIPDAARAAGCSTATFNVRLSRARARLARLLETPTNLETSWTL
ncbi:RNA polymerase sigma factor [Solirubrobacter soli]|uniref:RNA polymerase sigma factor n=1 Tax=Solirubrobacter soli TaxID=363832 RepID=UPI000429BFED|nr:RNA polymerase sigma factor [Solirubrobacter soli]